jgi:hypothetical protein
LAGAPNRLWLIQANDNAERLARLNTRFRPDAKGVGIEHSIPLGDFCRLLAKIAYCTTIATAATPGLARAVAREAEIRGCILGQDAAPLAPFFVGGAFFADDSRIDSIASGVGMHETIAYTQRDHDDFLMSVRIQLFALIGAPVYEVVVLRTSLRRPGEGAASAAG